MLYDMTVTADSATATLEMNVRVANEVRSWLARRQLTQRQLASVLGISPGSLSFRMKGKTPWTFSELVVAANWLDISLAQLLGEELVNEKNPHPMDGGSSNGSGRGTRSPDLTIRGFTPGVTFTHLNMGDIPLGVGQLIAAAWSKALLDLLAEGVGK